MIGGQVLVRATPSWLGYGCALGGALCWATGTVYFKGRPHGQRSFVFLVPLVAVVGDAIFLGDRFGVGGALILVGIWLVKHQQRAKAP